VYVAFDSDVMTKPQVQQALTRFGDFLTRRGAEAAYIYFPEGPDGSKIGLDDWLAAGNDPGALFDLCDSEIRKPTAPSDRLLCYAPTSPMPNARLAVDRLYRTDDGLELRYWRGGFYRWEGTYWPEMPLDELKSTLYDMFEDAVYMTGEGAKPFDPNRYKLADLIDAAKAVTIIPEALDPPAYVDGDSPVDPDQILPVRNGLLHIETRRLYEHDPRFFNHFALPYGHDDAAPTPARWLGFLDELWPGDADSIGTLQEWFGYCIAGDTSQHKILLILGPIRAGKGTVARVLKALIGRRNFTGPTLASFATNFGLQDLVGKPVAIISDARLPRSEASVIVERLLSISGEDTLTVDRKYRDHWTGKLPTRFTILTNELPHFWDSSGAIASRFLVLRLVKSFYGIEDTQLTDKLLEELPGILNWSLVGLERLRDRGHFVQPESATAVVQEMADLASPVGAFLRDRCVVGAGYTIAVDELWKSWKEWCDDYGRKPGTRQVFGRDLRAQVPEIATSRPRQGDQRVRYYEGLRLRSPDDDRDLVGTTMGLDRGPLRTADPGPQSSAQSETAKPLVTSPGPQWSAVQPNVLPGDKGVTESDRVCADCKLRLDPALGDVTYHPSCRPDPF
jgi:putative DNA primase/helicase